MDKAARAKVDYNNPQDLREYVILGTIDGNAHVCARFSPDAERFRTRFQREVLENERRAWYVDYYSTSAEQFNVNYFSSSPKIHWTDEDLSQREAGYEQKDWTSEDISDWFTSRDADIRATGTYAQTFKFEAGHTAEPSIHEVRFEAGAIVVNGTPDERAWERYIKLGISGALSDFRITKFLSLTIEKVS